MGTKARARGFTLVELLVVIGIIALLTSILLPALNKAKEQANQVKCLAQVRVLSQAAMLHAQDHRNHLPLAGLQWQIPSMTPDGLGDPGRRKFIYFQEGANSHPVPLTAALLIPLNVKFNLTNAVALQRDLEKENIQKYFRCPSDTVFDWGFTQRGPGYPSPPAPAGTGLPAGFWERMSYTFNESVLGFRDWTTTTPRGNVTKVKRTAQVMLFGDGRPRSLGAGDRWFTIFDRLNWSLYDYEVLSGYSRSFDRERHRGRMNVVFVDGHAETIMLVRGDMDRVGVHRFIRD
jgi:prepilin-type N-terminal cleavage/methylation domain-containing protein/prepilin-type processing-associated H-X9-DG protein